MSDDQIASRRCRQWDNGGEQRRQRPQRRCGTTCGGKAWHRRDPQPAGVVGRGGDDTEGGRD
jgi:hypothetical protein